MEIRKRLLPAAVLLVGLALILSVRNTTSAQTIVTTIPLTLSGQSIAVDTSLNRIFVCQQNSSGMPGFEVVVIDGSTNGILATIPVSGRMGEFGIAVNEVTGRVYVANSSGVVVIDENTLSILSTIPLPQGSTSVAVNPVTNRIYANCFGIAVAMIDGNSESVLATTFLSSIVRDLEVDTVRNRVYSTHESAGFFSVIDGASNSLITTVPISGRILAMAVDASLGQLYFAQDLISPPASLFILDSSSYATLATLTIGLRCEGVAVDRATHRVYSGSEENIPSLSGVTVIDGVNRLVAGFVSTGGLPAGRPIEANQITHRVYALDGVPEPGSKVIVIQDTPPDADIAVSKAASPNPAVTGSNITYTILVTNNGPGVAADVTVTDNLPAETSFVSCSSTGSGVCGGVGNNRTVTFASLASGASETINIVATVSCAVANGEVITNTAAVSSSTPDTATSNNSFTVTTTASNPPPAITCPADIATTTAPGQCSALVNYSVTAADNCPGVTVSCNPPSGSSFQKGAHAVACTAADSGGNSSACAFTVTVKDMEAPLIACPANITVGSDSGQCFATLNPGTATATDNCPGVIVSGARSDGRPLTDSYPIGTTTITWTATDGAGNQSGCSETVTVNAPQLTALGPARVWIGLKNGDDVGTKFDLLTEVFKNGNPVGSGQLNNVPGGGSGFNNAVLRLIDLTLLAPVDTCPGDTLSIRLSVRIAVGVSGHRSGTARLWFNDGAANSRFDATIDGVTSDYFLLDGLNLGSTAGPGPKKTADVFVDRLVGGNPFKPFGTWSRSF